MALAIAASNAHKLTTYFDLPDADVAELPKSVRNQLWTEVLGVPPLKGSKNLGDVRLNNLSPFKHLSQAFQVNFR